MTPFTTVRGIAAPMTADNIDTDVIMPKQFLKRIDRAGLAEGVFHDLRFDEMGAPNPDFILNKPPFDRARFLICGANFGCGSSREYAVWGLTQIGIQAIIAPSFAGIFFGNCEKNGLLAIELPRTKINVLAAHAAGPEATEIEIDLQNQTIQAAQIQFTFEIGPARKAALLSGRDHIAETLDYADDIHAYEANSAFFP